MPKPGRANASVERLFAEPFEPQWAQRQHEALMTQRRDDRNKWWRKLIIQRSELQWRLEAVRSQRRILERRSGVH